MLKFLSIKNLALIDEQEIQFTYGLNVLSGETGAGKSIILKAINFVLGDRADKSLIKNGSNLMKVDAVFEDVDEYVNSILLSVDVEPDETLILSRNLNNDGKGDIRINGKIVTLNMLKQVTPYLVDMYGQHENQTLLNPKKYLDIVDDFNDKKIVPLKQSLNSRINQLNDINKRLNENFGDEKEKERMIELLSYQINEIENANLIIGEEESLQQQTEKFLASQKITDNLSMSSEILNNGHMGSSISGAIKQVKNYLQNIAKYDEEFSELSKRMENTYLDIEDALDSIDSYINNAGIGEKELDRVEGRLDTIKLLKKKYGQNIEEIDLFLVNAKRKRDEIENNEELLKKLEIQKSELKDKIYSDCANLHSLRINNATLISNLISNEFVDLGMKNAKFEIIIDEIPSLSDFESKLTFNGLDKLQFMFSANLGTPLKELQKVISGGEMSRFMLAYKNVIATKDDIATLIFDEIDSGISGVVGQSVANKLANISRTHQVITITHLPQIASMGDSNYLIKKYQVGNTTKTQVTQITQMELIKEISRLSGSGYESELGIAHAEELRNKAIEYKS
ncbi:MAG: DNA repair protein RecN, partial [Clostridia bacterium]|nr:DNA repair protein RecN [Clostridia bacterium]